VQRELAEIVVTPTRISLYGDGERCGYQRNAGYAIIYRCPWVPLDDSIVGWGLLRLTIY
jgi:hypothetical protein